LLACRTLPGYREVDVCAHEAGSTASSGLDFGSGLLADLFGSEDGDGGVCGDEAATPWDGVGARATPDEDEPGCSDDEAAEEAAEAVVMENVSDDDDDDEDGDCECGILELGGEGSFLWACEHVATSLLATSSRKLSQACGQARETAKPHGSGNGNAFIALERSGVCFVTLAGSSGVDASAPGDRGVKTVPCFSVRALSCARRWSVYSYLLLLNPTRSVLRALAICVPARRGGGRERGMCWSDRAVLRRKSRWVAAFRTVIRR
jgi:hypothetical protein